MIRERAPAKLNLVLHVGPRRSDGLHSLCSLFASIDLADEVTVSASTRGADTVRCPGVDGPNLCHAALAELRSELPAGALPPLAVQVAKRIPVAGGLGGGSADAAATLRAANAIAEAPLAADALRAVGARVGADVPSQVEPGHAIVTGAGEVVERVSLPPLHFVLLPSPRGLATAAVYREADRSGATRPALDLQAVRALADGARTGRAPHELAPMLANDLQRAALSLRPELAESIAALERAGALVALLTGSGPTAFGLFADAEAARRGAAAVPGALVARTA